MTDSREESNQRIQAMFGSEGRTAMDGVDLTLELDKSIELKLLITFAPDGYLRRT